MSCLYKKTQTHNNTILLKIFNIEDLIRNYVLECSRPNGNKAELSESDNAANIWYGLT